MDDSARKYIFPTMLATPSTRVFLYMLAVFSLFMILSAMCFSVVSIPIRSIYRGLEYLLVVSRYLLELVSKMTEKRPTPSLPSTRQDIDNNAEGSHGFPERRGRSLPIHPQRPTGSNEAEQHKSI